MIRSAIDEYNTFTVYYMFTGDKDAGDSGSTVWSVLASFANLQCSTRCLPWDQQVSRLQNYISLHYRNEIIKSPKSKNLTIYVQDGFIWYSL